MQLSLSDLLAMTPARNGVGENAARYWLKTGLFGAADVSGGGGPGKPRTLDFHGAALFLAASELYGIGIKGLGFEQALLTIARQIRDRWPNAEDLAQEAPTLKANNGEGSIIELTVMGRTDEGDPLFKVYTDWNGGEPLKAGAIIRLNLLEILGPLIARVDAVLDGKH